MKGDGECVMFGADALLPSVWRDAAAAGPVRVFNPGLLRDGSGWLFAYRVVLPDGARRIAICRLNATLQVAAGSTLALSDHVQFRPKTAYPDVVTRWFADPRLYRLGGRLFVYWNSGWHEPRNYQFLQELDPTSLLPRDHPKELTLQGERQKLEKNWTLFEVAGAGGEVRVLYSINPHRVLSARLDGEADILCVPLTEETWSTESYPPHHGGLRGGAPPCRVDDAYWVFCHSVHDSPHGYRYRPAAYAFAAQAPYGPVRVPILPLELPNPKGHVRTYPKLNPAVGEVVYPCGAAHENGRWLISYGINDETCAIASASMDALFAATRPVEVA